MLLDEATSALDIETERRVLRGIMESGRNKACVITTHRMSVLEICSKVYRIADRAISPVSSQEIDQLYDT